MNNKIIILLAALFIGFSTALAQVTVSGVVVDESDFALPGASVIVKGEKGGVATDIDGKFTLSVPDENSVIVISFIGYTEQEIKVGDRRQFNIKMEPATQMMDEVVIVGFGTQKKVNATGAVKTIDNKVLESRPISNAVQGLQGAVAGLNITNDQGGGLGQEMQINIRGVGSIGEGSSSAPLVLIDGMEGDLSSINPNDIENISVLKDAAAASIYGSRAPFGVILVTTKSGERGLRINYTGNVRFQQPISVPDMVDSYTYALMVNDAFVNAGGSPVFGQSLLNKILAFQRGELAYGTEPSQNGDAWQGGDNSFANTDWYDVFLKDVSVSHEHNLSVSGGGDKITYYFSGNYLGQTGLFNYSDESFKRLAINGKVGVKFNDYVSFNWSSRLVSTDNEKPSVMNANFFHNIGRRHPTMPVTLPNGEYYSESMINNLQDGGRQGDRNLLLYNQANLTVEPIKGWKIYVDLNSRIENKTGDQNFNKLAQVMPDGRSEYYKVINGVNPRFETNANGTFRIQPGPGEATYMRYKGHVNYFQSNIYSDFEKTFNEKHYFKALLGMQTEYYYNETIRMATKDVLLEDVPFINPTSSSVLVAEDKGEWANLGIFGRVNYTFDNRYMLEVNLRYDGASRFPNDQRWAFFPSVSAGWNVANEKFFTPIRDAIKLEYFKLRGSYGQLGNQNTTSFYPYYQQMAATLGTVVLGGVQGSVLPVFDPYSASLTWETIENAGAGVDIGMFSNRLNASFDWYQRTTKDMIGPALALAAVYGADAPRTNNAELRTRGWEVEVSWRDRIGSDWSYGISASLSDYKSVVTKYQSPTGALIGPNGTEAYYQGKEIGEIWGYRVKGIAKSDIEMQQHLAQADQTSLGSKWGGGDLMYIDVNGDGKVDNGAGTISDHGDWEKIGNSTPRFAYSFTLEGQWKFIDIRAYFQGIGKRDIFFSEWDSKEGRLVGAQTFFGFKAEYQRSLYTDHLDYFRYAGSPLGANMDDPYFGRLRYDHNNTHVSDRFLQDASYLRLKNLQIGFTLPKTTKLSKYIDHARLYVSGENLFTITNLMIFDPEAVGKATDEYGAGKVYPQYRTWSVGLELTF